MRYLLILLLVLGVAGCDKLGDKQSATAKPGITAADLGRLYADSKTGEPLDVVPCGEGTGRDCKIFDGDFETTSVTTIAMISSIRKNNTTCCLTWIVGGQHYEFCQEIPGISVCPPPWH